MLALWRRGDCSHPGVTAWRRDFPDSRLGLAEGEAKKPCRAAEGLRDCSLRSREQS